jgi:ribose-phosphate pyrophosphokinase
MELVIITGNANRPLAERVCGILHTRLGEANAGRFADGEVDVSIPDVRGKHVVIFQSTPPPAENWVEIILMADAAKSGSAAEITVFMPYMGCARQDRKDKPHRPISARAMVKTLEAQQINRLMTIDLHAAQIQGFTQLPYDNMYLASTLLEFHRDLPWKTDVVIVSPDAGGVGRARAVAKKLGCEVAFIDKRREGPNQVEVMHVVGEVRGKIAVILDDMIDTAGSIAKGAEALAEEEATEVHAVATHGILSRNADPDKDSIERLKRSPLKTIVLSDTTPIPPEKRFDRMYIVSCAPIGAEMIRRVHNREPISPLFEEAFRWVE